MKFTGESKKMKIYTRILLMTIWILFIITNIAAQTGQLSGRVNRGQPPGATPVPVSDALVELFRTDIKGTLLSVKTDKNGDYKFTELTRGGVYFGCFSAPSLKAECRRLRVDGDFASHYFEPGDGRRLTGEEIQQVINRTSDELNINGFMGIKYGASIADAEKIIAAGKIGTIEKRYLNALDISGGKIIYLFQGYMGLRFPKNFDIELLFVNDKFYQATIPYEMAEDTYIQLLQLTKKNPFDFDIIKKDFDRIYHPADKYEDGAKGLGTAAWEFKQPQGQPNAIVLQQVNNRITLTFLNIDLFHVAVQKEKDMESAKVVYPVAAAYYREKKYDLAIAEYTKTLKLDPDYVDAYHYRGHSYSALEKYEAAVADFTSALKYEPENSHYLNDRAAAYAYWSDTKYELALADLAKAIKIKPNDARPYLLRARIFCAQGKKALAAADEKDAVSLGGEVKEKCQQ